MGTEHPLSQIPANMIEQWTREVHEAQVSDEDRSD
jgi:hypothetical protein